MALPSRSHTSYNTINSSRVVGQLGGTGGGNADLRKQAAQKLAQKQQQQLKQQQKMKQKEQQKKAALPLFPTERTRGAVVPGVLQPGKDNKNYTSHFCSFLLLWV
jgi:type IV secretory pathway VirB10-like protein